MAPGSTRVAVAGYREERGRSGEWNSFGWTFADLRRKPHFFMLDEKEDAVAGSPNGRSTDTHCCWAYRDNCLRFPEEY